MKRVELPPADDEDDDEEDVTVDLSKLTGDLDLDASVTSGGDPAAWNFNKERQEEGQDEAVDTSKLAADGEINAAVTSGGDAAAWAQGNNKGLQPKKPD